MSNTEDEILVHLHEYVAKEDKLVFTADDFSAWLLNFSLVPWVQSNTGNICSQFEIYRQRGLITEIVHDQCHKKSVWSFVTPKVGTEKSSPLSSVPKIPRPESMIQVSISDNCLPSPVTYVHGYNSNYEMRIGQLEKEVKDLKEQKEKIVQACLQTAIALLTVISKQD